MTIKANRYRKPLATTVDPQTLFIINSLAKPNLKGQMLDEIVFEWLTNCAWFNSPDAGMVMLKDKGLYLCWEDPNNEQHGPEFKTCRDALLWLKKTYPEANQEIINFEE